MVALGDLRAEQIFGRKIGANFVAKLMIFDF